jgi:glycosyltransferase involved in cell wall biosynthesis
MRRAGVKSAHLRVLYVDYSLGFGGAIKSLALTLRELPSVEKFIFTSQDPELVETWFSGMRVFSFRRLVNYRTIEKIRARLQLPALQLIALKLAAGVDMLVIAKNLGRLIWFLRRHRIDIVHLNNGFLPQEALLATRVLRIPCVVHLRDFQLDARGPASIAARDGTEVITVSDAVAASLDNTPIPASKRTTIHDPVDLQLMEHASGARQRVRKELGLGDQDIAVGIFGRVIPWKGQLEFVKALTIVMRTAPGVIAVIVGDESDGGLGYIRQVHTAIESSGLSERFISTGYQKSVEDYYAAMDIVVHASVTPEPFGMVVPEAMAAGCAVIAADAGGPREVIDNETDGLLTPPGDIQALSDAVLRLASDQALRARIADLGKRKALARFGIAESARRVADVYVKVLTGKH